MLKTAKKRGDSHLRHHAVLADILWKGRGLGGHGGSLPARFDLDNLALTSIDRDSVAYAAQEYQ